MALLNIRPVELPSRTLRLAPLLREPNRHIGDGDLLHVSRAVLAQVPAVGPLAEQPMSFTACGRLVVFIIEQGVKRVPFPGFICQIPPFFVRRKASESPVRRPA